MDILLSSRHASSLPGLMAAVALTLAALWPASALAFGIEGSNGTRIEAREIATFDEPWAMTFLPDGTMLVTEKHGQLLHVTQSGQKTPVDQMFDGVYGGQGWLGDVVLDPNFVDNRQIYLSFIESLDDGATRGAAVVRATLVIDKGQPVLRNPIKIWRQQPYVPGKGHFSHRIAFGPAGTPHEGYLFITSGERQKQTPAQDMTVNLGKVIRLNRDGAVPSDNPFADQGGIAKQFYSIGHHNLLGIDFDGAGHLWTHEMGPQHGDELNRIVAGQNYGWPIVSNGDNYSGVTIPDHDTHPEFEAPAVSWVPSIGPAGFVIYGGDRFANWQGNGLIGGLVAKALIRVELQGQNSYEAERYSWNKRVREVEQGPDGAVWVLEDKKDARLLKLTPEI